MMLQVLYLTSGDVVLSTVPGAGLSELVLSEAGMSRRSMDVVQVPG
jgi:hypothetical protein